MVVALMALELVSAARYEFALVMYQRATEKWSLLSWAELVLVEKPAVGFNATAFVVGVVDDLDSACHDDGVLLWIVKLAGATVQVIFLNRDGKEG